MILGLIFHFLFHLVKMFKSYFGAEYKAVGHSHKWWCVMDRITFVISSLWCTRFSMVNF